MTAAFTVIGEALVDLVESAGAPGTYRAHAGGSLFNVAVTLGRLGADVSLVARSGTDTFGRLLEVKARASGVSFDQWQIVDEPTTLAVASVDATGHAVYDFYLDATAGLNWDEGLLDLVPLGGVLHLGSLASWRPPSGRLLQALQRRAFASGSTLVSYDPNVRPALIPDRDAARADIERCVSAAHLVKASDEDLAFLYPDLAPAEVARRWCGLGATVMVVTLGGDGAAVFGLDGELTRRPGRLVAVADTVGAGDSFAGGLLSALVEHGAGTPESLRAADPGVLAVAVDHAVLVSSITCERAGANPPTRAEVDERAAAAGQL